LYGSLLALTVIIYGFVWEPVHSDLEKLRLNVPRLEREYSAMQRTAKQLTHLKQRANNNQGSLSGQRIITVIEKTAATHGIKSKIDRMRPNAKDRTQVDVWLKEIAFDNWLMWLERLKENNIEVLSVNIVQQEINKVDIRVTFRKNS